MKNNLFSFLFLSFLMVFSRHALAQSEVDDIVKNTQEDIMIIFASGAGGAVLGLSTLSFVETPSRNLSNIWTGGALGIIAGVFYVAYNSAQKGSEDLQSEEASIRFNSFERVVWHQSQISTRASSFKSLSAPLLNLQF